MRNAAESHGGHGVAGSGLLVAGGARPCLYRYYLVVLVLVSMGTPEARQGVSLHLQATRIQVSGVTESGGSDSISLAAVVPHAGRMKA
jgi:hypothetical protein